jgi:hypothetical protein
MRHSMVGPGFTNGRRACALTLRPPAAISTDFNSHKNRRRPNAADATILVQAGFAWQVNFRLRHRAEKSEKGCAVLPDSRHKKRAKNQGRHHVRMCPANRRPGRHRNRSQLGLVGEGVRRAAVDWLLEHRNRPAQAWLLLSARGKPLKPVLRPPG